ncbi:MAG: PEP/pyruvate-binding domain-containing protein [Dehalococcoidia bacterium]|nr:PEP/pyruvate-binding domain-containing protein [Dehalococcoidia bacterium]
MTGMIAWLDSPEGATANRIGGKGASLARLGAAGFPVPPGFAITVDAYRRFHDDCALDSAMAALLAVGGGRPSPAQVRDACAPILEQLQNGSMPRDVADVVAEAYALLEERAGPDATFAVRSSGVSEDSAGASFAGLYESYLNLRGAEAVLAAVRKCYDCLWQPRAAHYRAIKGIDHRKEAMGVVVMQTVPSFVSGVAFSLNPVTGAHDEVLINASWGLGEAIVSGLVTPDSYVALKDGTVAKKDVFEKHMRVVAVPGGTEKQETPANLQNAPALADEQIARVATTTATIEKHYGCPVDIEFAYDGAGRFYLLQARPITT